MSQETLVEIIDVCLSKPRSQLLQDCAIDTPNNSTSNAFTIYLSGWILGKKSKAIAVEILNNNTVIHKTIPNTPRLGVAQRYPELPWAKNCGFGTLVGVIGLPLEAELHLQAILEDSSRVSIGTIRLRHQPLKSNYQSSLQPLIVTCIGRTGTTWLMQLLSQHPNIVVGKTYPYEIQAAQYWMQMLRVLSQPANPPQSTPSQGFEQELQWIGYNPFYHPSKNSNEILSWFGRDYPAQLASFCLQSIDSYYQQIALSQSKTFPLDTNSSQLNNIIPIYFAEKYVFSPNLSLFLELYPQAREIILVRDFRDMVCSILAYNAKRGYNAFGREGVQSDREYVENVAKFHVLALLENWKQRSRQCHLIRYEDLILSPIETLSSLFDYLELEYSLSQLDSMLEKAKEDTKILERHQSSSEPKASIGRWKKDLDASLQVLCNQVFAEALQEFGYTLNAYNSSSILNYGSKMSDREWLEVIVKSVDNPVIDNMEMPGFPASEIQHNTVGSSGDKAIREGFNFYCEIKRYINQLRLVLSDDSSVLDFGCGWGRIIRFFMKDVPPHNLYGVDVNPKMIEICRQTIRQGNYSLINRIPPLEWADNSFDVIYAYSVFSHLPEHLHIKWVEEFSRILKPGGLFFATTHARSFIEFCRSLRGKTHTFAWYRALANSFLDTKAALADYDRGNFMYSPTGGAGSSDGSMYGDAVIPRVYVETQWTKYLEFYDFVDDPTRLPQNLIVMRKSIISNPVKQL